MTRTPHLQAATAEEFLDHEEGLATQDIADSVQRLGNDLCASADLRRRIRRHPFLATGLGAVLGFVGGPLILRALERRVSMTSSVPMPVSRRPRVHPCLALAWLRVVRAGR